MDPIGEYVNETLIVSPYPFWVNVLIFAAIAGFIQFIISFCTVRGKYNAIKKDISKISYEQEKGKNLATKEDMKEITKIIEEAKGISNVSNSIDTHLLRLLIRANESIEFEKRMSFQCTHEGYAFDALFSLCSYLEKFKHRYENNQNAKTLIIGYDDLFNLEKNNEANHYFETSRYNEILRKLKPNIDELLKKMMPKYN